MYTSWLASNRCIEVVKVSNNGIKGKEDYPLDAKTFTFTLRAWVSLIQHSCHTYTEKLLVQNVVHKVTDAIEKPAGCTATNTLFRLDGILSSIITIKLTSSTPCSQFEPGKEGLESARKATIAYKHAHIAANMFSFNTCCTHYYVVLHIPWSYNCIDEVTEAEVHKITYKVEVHEHVSPISDQCHSFYVKVSLIVSNWGWDHCRCRVVYLSFFCHCSVVVIFLHVFILALFSSREKEQNKERRKKANKKDDEQD